MSLPSELWGDLGIGALGVVSFVPSLVRASRQAARIPPGCRSVVVFTLPYHCDNRPGNLSRYARGLDYHLAARRIGTALAERLIRRFGGMDWQLFCDISPFDEVSLAVRAGLGVPGDHNLLITPRHGSFVFIAELCTTLPLAVTEHETRRCGHCGLCRAACPSGALSAAGFSPRRCLSDITQRKGALTPEETALMRATGTAWGCDLCQLACPHNARPQPTAIPEFSDDLIYNLDEAVAEAPKDRAFAWRGTAVLRRNLAILSGDAPQAPPADPPPADHAERS